MGRRWAVYSRVSRVGDRADTLISPELQQQRATDYAAARGLEVEILPAELDVSGGTTSRPILDAILDGIDDGTYAGVIVAQLDRLSRMDLADALKTIERVESAGGQVIAVAENFDAGTPEGRMGRNVFLAMGQMQLDRYKLQFRAAKARAVQAGIWPMARVPLGYRKRDDRRLEPDPAVAPRVVRGFEARAGGASWNAVARVLGVGQSGAKKLIANRVFLGEIRVGEWHNPTAHEPIVTVDLFEAAQQSHPKPARHGRVALLGGLVHCAGCGYLMSPTNSERDTSYKCNPRNKKGGVCQAPAIIGQKKLDGYVEPLVLAWIAGEVRGTDKKGELASALAELEAATAERVAYHQTVRLTEVGPEAFAAGDKARATVEDEARRKVAEARLAAQHIPAGGDIHQLWETLTVEERRHVLRSSLSAIVVTKGRGDPLERVRLIAPGHTIHGPVPEGNLPGEIRVPRTKNIN